MHRHADTHDNGGIALGPDRLPTYHDAKLEQNKVATAFSLGQLAPVDYLFTRWFIQRSHVIRPHTLHTRRHTHTQTHTHTHSLSLSLSFFHTTLGPEDVRRPVTLPNRNHDSHYTLPIVVAGGPRISPPSLLSLVCVCVRASFCCPSS
ncbi:hypothetical protein LY76DRAFT_252600 [Colletotrichum caudatum]|nr:hypothetical protein LY76DRAFT_252600 [Colletotrichum caudatum]